MRRKTHATERGSRRLRMILTGQNVAQAAVTISVGIAFAVATFLASEAAGRWSDAVKEDVKWSAGLIEDVRYLYTEEAPFAFDYAVTVARADALTAAAKGRPASEAGAALLEAHASRASVERRREEYLLNKGTLLSEEYWQQDHFDVAARLDDARADAKSTVKAEPDAAIASGDRYAMVALAASLIPIAIASGYLIWVVGRRRRVIRNAGAANAQEDVALIPDPAEAWYGGAAALALAAWLLLVLLPPIQISMSLAEDKASAESSAGAVEVMRTILVSNLAAGLEAELLHRAADFENRAEAREQAYGSLPEEATPGQAAIVDAERSMADKYTSIAQASIPSVKQSSNVSLDTVLEITADPDDWQQVLADQNDAADAAELAGQRDNAMTVAVVLAGITTTLTALAAANRTSRVVPLLAGVSLAGAGGIALLSILL